MGSFLFDIIVFILAGYVLRAIARSLGSLFQSPQAHVRTSTSGPATSSSDAPHRGEMARDPVCGMFVSTELPHHLTRGNDTLHFCSRECLEKFQKDAEHVAS